MEIGQRKRICIMSLRAQNSHVSRCSDYEFEDVIWSIDDVDLLTVEQGVTFSLRKRLVNQATRHISTFFSGISPSFSRLSLGKEYDLFMAVCEDITDVLVVNSIRNWDQKCKVSVCWVDEIWLSGLEKNRRLCEHILSRFDFIFTGCHQSVKRLEEIVGKPCRYMPPGVDMLKFIPGNPPPKRDIDFLSMGRRPQLLHQKLLCLKESKPISYMYDSTSSSSLYVENYLLHRDKLRDLLKRSRYLIVFPSKFDVPNQTKGQVEFGFRFFEGAAAGVILVGEVPNSPVFRKLFYWVDAVIELPEETEDLYRLLESLDNDKERIESARNNNIYHCLMEHDWVYRWRGLLEIVNLKPSPKLIERELALKELAGCYKPSD
jgi:hypothetical protein